MYWIYSDTAGRMDFLLNYHYNQYITISNEIVHLLEEVYRERNSVEPSIFLLVFLYSFADTYSYSVAKFPQP